MARVKVATSNLKRNLPWAAVRRDLLRILDRGPGVIGMQEIYGGRLKQVRRLLAQHGYGLSVVNDVPIAFNVNKYKLNASNARRLPGKAAGHWNPARFGNWVALTDRRTGQQIVLTNTHLDHERPKTQAAQIRALADLQRDLRKRFGKNADYFLTGDMNTANKQRLAALLNGTGLRHAHGHIVDQLYSSEQFLRQGSIHTASDHDTYFVTYNANGRKVIVNKPPSKPRKLDNPVENFSRLNTPAEKALLRRFAKNQGIDPTHLGQLEHRLNTLRSKGQLGETGRRLFAAANGWDEAAKKNAGKGKGKGKSVNVSAFEMFSDLLESWGIPVGSDIQNIIEKAAKDGYTADELELLLPKIEKTKSFQRRFPGYSAAVKKGYVSDVSDYLNLEGQYRSILESNGLPKGFYDNPSDLGNWIAGGVSPDELQTRVNDAVALTNQVDPTMRNLMQKFYGLSTGDVAAYFLDPKKAGNIIQRQYNAAGIATAASRAGLNVTGMKRYEDLLDQGLTADQAAAGYGTVAELTNTVGELGDIYGEKYGQTEAERDVFFNDSAQRTRLVNKERATFGGSGRAANTGSSTRQAY